MKKNVSSFFVILAGCLWGFMGLLVRSLNREGLAAMDICFIRASITLVAMFLLLLVTRRDALKIKWKDVWCFVGTGAVSVTFFNFCYFKTMALTSLSVAAVMLYTAPAFVMILSVILFHEKFTVKKLLALLFSFCGCAFVSGIMKGTGALSLSGICFGLGAGIGYALYSIFGRYALEKGYQSDTISFYTFLFAAVSSLFFVDVPKIGSVMIHHGPLCLKTVVLVLLVTLFPYYIYTKGLEHLETGTASVLASVEPVVATLIGILVYREVFDGWNMLGIVLVLFSIVLLNGGRRNVKE